jgi:hypothetical protein
LAQLLRARKNVALALVPRQIDSHTSADKEDKEMMNDQRREEKRVGEDPVRYHGLPRVKAIEVGREGLGASRRETDNKNA